MNNQNVIKTNTQYRAQSAWVVNFAQYLPVQPANYPSHGNTDLTHTTAPSIQASNIIVIQDAPELTKKSHVLCAL